MRQGSFLEWLSTLVRVSFLKSQSPRAIEKVGGHSMVKPGPNWVKLNPDGAAKCSPGLARVVVLLGKQTGTRLGGFYL